MVVGKLNKCSGNGIEGTNKVGMDAVRNEWREGGMEGGWEG